MSNAYLSSPNATVAEIPLVGTAQTLSLTLAGANYQLTIRWHDTLIAPSGYVLDIYDDLGNPLVCGVAMVTGCDLLDPYAYLQIGGSLYLLSDGADPLALPAYGDLGTTTHLYFVSVPA